MATNLVEAFLVDSGFLDRSKIISEFLIEESGSVCVLTPKALSYFSNPAAFQDKRDPASRSIGWTAETSPAVVVDEDAYSVFVDTINDLSPTISSAFFKLVDILAFNYIPNTPSEDVEALLQADVDVSAIYVPNTFALSASVIEGTVYKNSGISEPIGVPSFVKFSIEVPMGSGTETYGITLFTSVPAWISGYDFSTIVKVIPPLPYQQLYTASLTNTEASVFSTASITASLSYNTTKAQLGTVSVSGITEYFAILTDNTGATASVPFNILYKGRSPTLSEIREAIRTELIASGVGTAEGWEARIPGVFVAGRFYIVPLWDLVYLKPDQEVFPSVLDYSVIGERTNTILDSTGFGDLREHINVFNIYYDRLTLTAVPDLTGVVDIQKLMDVIPDYQNWSPSDENFAYMTDLSKQFSTYINQTVALNITGDVSDEIVVLTENLLTFHSFVVGKFEICVITKECYTEIMESTQ